MVAVKLTGRWVTTGQAPLSAWAGAVGDHTEAHEAVAEVVSEDISERFDSRSDPWGRAWAPLSPVPIELRRRQGSRTANSLEATKYVEVVDAGRRVIVGLASRVAGILHRGAPGNKAWGRGRAPIPARPILPLRGGVLTLPDQLRRQILDAFREGLVEAVRRHRRGV